MLRVNFTFHNNSLQFVLLLGSENLDVFKELGELRIIIQDNRFQY